MKRGAASSPPPHPRSGHAALTGLQVLSLSSNPSANHRAIAQIAVMAFDGIEVELNVAEKKPLPSPFMWTTYKEEF